MNKSQEQGAAKLKVACIQMRSGRVQQENIAALEALVTNAARKGAKYVQTPEMTGILERDGDALMSVLKPEEEDPVFAASAALARKLGIWLHLGSTAVRSDAGRAANRSALFRPDGSLAGTYDKIHMFDVDVDAENRWRESARYDAGSQATVVGMDGIRTGLSICYDLRFPHLFRQLSLAGAELLTCPAAFTRPTGEAHWEILLRARAIENGAYMIAAAQGGVHEDGRSTWGHSMIVAPSGKILAELAHDRPDVLFCEIDIGEVQKMRNAIPNLANSKKFAISTI